MADMQLRGRGRQTCIYHGGWDKWQMCIYPGNCCRVYDWCRVRRRVRIRLVSELDGRLNGSLRVHPMGDSQDRSWSNRVHCSLRWGPVSQPHNSSVGALFDNPNSPLVRAFFFSLGFCLSVGQTCICLVWRGLPMITFIRRHGNWSGRIGTPDCNLLIKWAVKIWWWKLILTYS